MGSIKLIEFPGRRSLCRRTCKIKNIYAVILRWHVVILKQNMLIFGLGGIGMTDEAIRKLLCSFVEEGELADELSERILQRILDALFGKKEGIYT